MDNKEDKIKKTEEEVYEKIQYLKTNSEDEEFIKRLEFVEKTLKYGENSTKHIIMNKKLNKINKGLTFMEKAMNIINADINIDPSRLLGLTDGIFGMVMTLLVFGISLPEVEILNYADFLTFFSSISSTIGITIISFIIISTIWIYHHEFIKIKTLNLFYLWLNILFLICISFIPFTTSLIGNYSHFFLSEVLFGSNIFLTLLIFFLMYIYAYNMKFLEEMPSKKERTYILHTLIIIMSLTMIINLLDYNMSSNFIYLFLLIPIISTIRDIMFKFKD